MKVAEQGNAVGSIMCSVHAKCCGGKAELHSLLSSSACWTLKLSFSLFSFF